MATSGPDVGTTVGSEMSRIISVIAVLLACMLGAQARAQDEPAKATAPAAGSEPANTPPPPAEAEAAKAPAPAAGAEPPAPAEAAGAQPAAPADAGSVQLQENAPARYTVKQGDTLWGIANRFLKNPWKWPEVWGMNKEDIQNPHLIYPGEVIALDRSGALPRLRLEGVPEGGLARWNGFELQVTKLEPQVRTTALAAAIPTIAAKDLAPFITRSLVLEPGSMSHAPKIITGVDYRVVLGANDTVFAVGVDRSKGSAWSIYRPGRSFVDPDTKEDLGAEAIYLGEAEVESFGQMSALRILRSRLEVSSGDRLALRADLPMAPYVPRAPDQKIFGKVLGGDSDTLSEIGPLAMVVLNRGARDGLAPGQVLSLYRNLGRASVDGRMLSLPQEEYGLVMIYRVFPKVSFALVMAARHPVNINDVVRNP